MPAILPMGAAAATIALLVTGAVSSAGPSDYLVRAIFDNAANATTGEDVKIAGVPVGEIDSLDVTPDKKAAVVLRITRAGFRDFRRDAHCSIRPQSLIGEKFVDCVPTQGRADGTPPAPPLPVIPNGRPGAGQHLLGVQSTSSPVDIDLLPDILRLPYRQRLTLLVSELGTGLAANGTELRNVIHRADPALAQLDRVLAILAAQNRALADLAVSGDRVLEPLGRRRAHLADLVDQANTTLSAAARQRDDLERIIQRLPAFLDQLQATAPQLGNLAGRAAPVVADLHSAAVSLNTLIERLGPFSESARPALRSLGRAAVTGRRAVLSARPVTADLQATGRALRPVGRNAAALTTSLQRTGGIERVLDYLFYQTTSTNGFDAFGHYLRAEILGGDVLKCSLYTITPVPGCSANFHEGVTSAALRARQLRADPTLARVLALLEGRPLAALLPSRAHRRASPPATRRLTLPTLHVPRPRVPKLRAPSSAGARPAVPAPAPAPAPGAPAPARPSDPVSSLLDFLLGGG